MYKSALACLFLTGCGCIQIQDCKPHPADHFEEEVEYTLSSVLDVDTQNLPKPLKFEDSKAHEH